MPTQPPKPVGLWIGAVFGVILTFLPMWSEVFTKGEVDDSSFYEQSLPIETDPESEQMSMSTSIAYTQTWIPTPLPLIGGICALLFGIRIGKRSAVKAASAEGESGSSGHFPNED